MVIWDSAAAGTPVVISDKVGISREVSKKNAALIVKTNSDSLYRGLITLIEDTDLRQKLISNGREMVKELYDINIVADMMIKEFRKIQNEVSAN